MYIYVVVVYVVVVCDHWGLLSAVFCRGMLRVAVIGAGAAGLCVARHILSHPNVFAPPVVFELTENVGGTWCYYERVGRSDDGRLIHSSMYRDLRYETGHLSGPLGKQQQISWVLSPFFNRTNLPKEVMMFPDFPFDPQLSSFLPHQEVQNYLEQYCQEHNIRPHIRVSPRFWPQFQTRGATGLNLKTTIIVHLCTSSTLQWKKWHLLSWQQGASGWGRRGRCCPPTFLVVKEWRCLTLCLSAQGEKLWTKSGYFFQYSQNKG